MKLDPEALYRQLGRLIETMPNLTAHLTDDAEIWLGRAFALINQIADTIDKETFRSAINRLHSRRVFETETGAAEVTSIVYRALALAELAAPPSARGAFIPVGGSFDAFASVSKVFQGATSDVLVVDPYLDESILTDFATAIPESVAVRLLADEANCKPTLKPAAERWVAQNGSKRPLAVRLALPRALHDRAILIDGKTAWTLTQSFKDLAKRSPAEIVRADDVASLKIAAYEAIWSSAKVIG